MTKFIVYTEEEEYVNCSAYHRKGVDVYDDYDEAKKRVDWINTFGSTFNERIWVEGFYKAEELDAATSETIMKDLRDEAAKKEEERKERNRIKRLKRIEETEKKQLAELKKKYGELGE